MVKNLVRTWNLEARKYNFETSSQVDYLANFYHLSKCLGKPKGKKILEVGSGTGQASAYLASKGGRVYLVDVSNKALDFSKKYFASRGLPIKTFRQDAFKMKFPPKSFDWVWNGGVLEHYKDKDKILMLEKMWSLVKPGGKLLIAVPNAHDYPFILAKLVLRLRKKWTFGYEDDMTIIRMKNIAQGAGIKNFTLYAYNPIVGFWFFPYGREFTNFLGLNTSKMHRLRSPFGHVIILYAQKNN